MYSFYMRYYKKTPNKTVFTEGMNRIGRIYIPHQLKNRLGIADEILVQLDTDKRYLPPGGYITSLKPNKEYEACVRFSENLNELGEIGYVYVRREVLDALGVDNQLAMRIVPYNLARQKEGAVIETAG
ncbi:hypothetical protein JCM39194_17440 [Desulfotomaculum varum]